MVGTWAVHWVDRKADSKVVSSAGVRVANLAGSKDPA